MLYPESEQLGARTLDVSRFFSRVSQYVIPQSRIVKAIRRTHCVRRLAVGSTGEWRTLTPWPACHGILNYPTTAAGCSLINQQLAASCCH